MWRLIKNDMANPHVKKLRLPKIVEVEFSELNNAIVVFKHATNSVNMFYELFQKNRRGVMGSTTHVDQDLLRAMLVFSCSGLDAVVKQLIKDSLIKVINTEPGAQQEFQKFIERRMKKEGKEKFAIDAGWVASIFASRTPREYLTNTLQNTLLRDSLQSRDQLLKVAAHFAITRDEILKESEITKKSFDVRNEIIHEMDTDLSGQKKRRQRAAKIMVGYSENILGVSALFINVVHKKIYGAS